jgi:hypothetical protein
MATGVLIAESIAVPATLSGVAFTVTKLERVTPDNISDEQRTKGIPPDWTLLHLHVPDEDAPRLIDALSEVLDDFGWYADLKTDDEIFVAFAGRVFRYAREDDAAHDEAVAYGRARGVPDPQLDWR